MVIDVVYWYREFYVQYACSGDLCGQETVAFAFPQDGCGFDL